MPQVSIRKATKSGAEASGDYGLYYRGHYSRKSFRISRKIKDYKKLAEELGVGEITLRDIVKELEKPARDPREEMPRPVLRTDVLDMKDLKEGMILKGTVRNVIDLCFVDIGVHQDGLVHISEISEKISNILGKVSKCRRCGRCSCDR